MLANLLTKAPKRLFPSSMSRRTRFVVLAVMTVVCYVLGITYHVLVWQTGAPPAPVVEAMYNLVVLVGFTSLWLFLSLGLAHRNVTPARIFWTILLIGLFAVGLAQLATSVGTTPEEVEAFAQTGNLVRGFALDTDVPLTLITVFKMNVVSLMLVSFAFFVVLSFRNLVLFKRTRRSQRNWYIMLGLVVVASLSAFMRDPRADLSLVQSILVALAIVFMIVNAFRLSWIVFLSFREKVIGIVICLALMAGLVSLSLPGVVPGSTAYLHHYSYPLSVLSELAFGFGILYCTTSFLSLLFHLPTTSDFQRKVGEVSAMHSLTNLVTQVFDSERLYSTIVASPVDADAARCCWLALPDPESGTLRPHVVATRNVTRARVNELIDVAALYEEVQSMREPLYLEEAPTDHRVDVRPGDGMGSILLVPLIARDEMLGALFVTRDVTRGFEQDDVEATSVFAAQAALALDNARLFEEQVERERLTRELDIAREVQRKLLPQRLPRIQGWSLAASSVSAQEVGGDYYDFVELDDGRLAFIIADVSGKGTSAAFYMAELQGIFHAVSHIAHTPADFLTHANRALAGSLERHVFVSVIYGTVDLEAERIVLARGGHCPAATISVDGTARFIRSQGMGLGLDRGELFARSLSEEDLSLQPGDIFVLYTDGVVESRNAAGEEYGYDRLLQALTENRHEDADDLHRLLLDDLHTFLEHDQYDDDMTLVVMKWHGIDVVPVVVATGEARAPFSHIPVPVE